MTPSAVSQRVKALEQRTGRVLLMRTKPVRPTESGEVVVRFARQLARLEQDASPPSGWPDQGDDAADGRGELRLPGDLVPARPRPRPGGAGHLYELRREDQDHTAALLREGLVMAAVTSSPGGRVGVFGAESGADALSAGGDRRVRRAVARAGDRNSVA
ncbi:putative HTH-type transcriptional regulator [Streptomyces microflavus]